MHSDDKGFSCSKCGKKFPHANKLTAHERVHTNERPFSCTLCQMKFKEKSKLKRHLRTHTNDKPFICSKCGKKFAQSGNLKNHERMHMVKRPFSCPYCEQSFDIWHDLQNHIQTHEISVVSVANEDLLKCCECDKVFKGEINFNGHTCEPTEVDCCSSAPDGICEKCRIKNLELLMLCDA